MSDTTVIIRRKFSVTRSEDHARKANRARETVRTFQGNSSPLADRYIAAHYESMRRNIPHLRKSLPVVAWFYLDGKAPITGAPASGTTSQLDPQGLVLSVRLPEPAWIVSLLTGRMLVRMGISLPDGRGRIVSTGLVGWMEAHRPQDPLRLGLYFTELTGFDRDRILRLVRDDRQGPCAVAAQA